MENYEGGCVFYFKMENEYLHIAIAILSSAPQDSMENGHTLTSRFQVLRSGAGAVDQRRNQRRMVTVSDEHLSCVRFQSGLGLTNQESTVYGLTKGANADIHRETERESSVRILVAAECITRRWRRTWRTRRWPLTKSLIGKVVVICSGINRRMVRLAQRDIPWRNGNSRVAVWSSRTSSGR